MLVADRDITALAEILRHGGKRIVFTNGCFDILHAGHVRYLAAAKNQGDILIVGLNSDASVRRLKGSTRPINGEEDRAEVLSSLHCVDYVVIFSEQTAETIVGKIKPDVYVKGADYTIDTLPEAKVVAGYGGKVAFIPLVPGRSTSNVIKKIEAQEKS